ncbi:MAG: hypothetical protein RSB71_01450 [Bacilli bacterium]
MNFYLLQLVGKWISLLMVSLMSLFGFDLKETNSETVNTSTNKNVSVVTEVVKYDTIKEYNSSLPKNISNILTTGKNGAVFKDKDGQMVILENKVDEKLELGTGKYGLYTGVMTGYGPDCVTCSGEGYVACKTPDKQKFNIKSDGIYYEDTKFGKVRVLAAALKEFPCGTIVEVDSKTLGKFTGVVLDTGYGMRKHLEEGIYHFDVAYETEKDEMTLKTTDMSGNVKYSIQRWGW